MVVIRDANAPEVALLASHKSSCAKNDPKYIILNDTRWMWDMNFFARVCIVLREFSLRRIPACYSEVYCTCQLVCFSVLAGIMTFPENNLVLKWTRFDFFFLLCRGIAKAARGAS